MNESSSPPSPSLRRNSMSNHSNHSQSSHHYNDNHESNGIISSTLKSSSSFSTSNGTQSPPPKQHKRLAGFVVICMVMVLLLIPSFHNTTKGSSSIHQLETSAVVQVTKHGNDTHTLPRNEDHASLSPHDGTQQPHDDYHHYLVLIRSIDNVPWTKLANLLTVLEHVLASDRALLSKITNNTQHNRNEPPTISVRTHWMLNRLPRARILSVTKLLDAYQQTYTIIPTSLADGALDETYYAHLPYNFGYHYYHGSLLRNGGAQHYYLTNATTVHERLALRYDRLLYATHLSGIHNDMLSRGFHHYYNTFHENDASTNTAYLLPWRMDMVLTTEILQLFQHIMLQRQDASTSSKWPRPFASTSTTTTTTTTTTLPPDVIALPVQYVPWNIVDNDHNVTAPDISTQPASLNATTLSYALAIAVRAAPRAHISPTWINPDQAIWYHILQNATTNSDINVTLTIPDWQLSLLERYPSRSSTWTTSESPLRVTIATSSMDESTNQNVAAFVPRLVPVLSTNETHDEDADNDNDSLESNFETNDSEATNTTSSQLQQTTENYQDYDYPNHVFPNILLQFVHGMDWQVFQQYRSERGAALFWDTAWLRYERRLATRADAGIPPHWRPDRLSALLAVTQTAKDTSTLHHKSAGPWHVTAESRIYTSSDDAMAWHDLARNVTTWALASYLHGDDNAGRYAVKQLKDWFWNDKSMLPQLRDNFDEQDLVDWFDLVYLLDAVRLLKQGDFLKSRQESMFTKWCRDFLTWIQEARDLHNQAVSADGGTSAHAHLGIYYDGIVAALASFVQNDPVSYRTLSMVPLRLPGLRDYIINQQPQSSASCRSNDPTVSLRRILYAWHTVARQSQGVTNLWKVLPWWNEGANTSAAPSLSWRIPEDPKYGMDWIEKPSALCILTESIITKCSSEIKGDPQQTWGPILETYRRFCTSTTQGATKLGRLAPTRYHLPSLYNADSGIAPFWNIGYRKFP